MDEFRFKIFPLTPGKLKTLFNKGTIPASLSLIESLISTTGVSLSITNELEK
jgi:hypothetical protein